MKTEVLKSNAEVLLTEAMSVLTGLMSDGLFNKPNEVARLLARARRLLSNPTIEAALDFGPRRALDAPYDDFEVVGLDNDGQVMYWDAPNSRESATGDLLHSYGIGNLKLHEIARVGVSVEQWLEATVMLQGDRQRQEGWSRNVFVKAHSTSEYGGEGPTYAKIVVDAAFVGRLLRLSNLCKKDALSEVRVCDGPQLWGGCDEDALRLTCAELVVSGSQFWFTDSPKHANYIIESDAHQISKLIEAAMSGEGDVYLAEYDEVQLRQLVEDAQDDEGDVDDLPAAQLAGDASAASAPDGAPGS